ncbi:hypothetical protein, conserved [Eimeria brunetti]|uniref:Uncharacterized protein n=1 Tax=Eimeria brunetti TaxID=51314 RepID=U6L6P2_9EIME|nr:hypothetical protein, conserved [Eimeria brunetti]
MVIPELGLGMATKVAIGTAALLESEGCVTIEKVETAYFASARRKFVPKITILCRKTKDFAAIMEGEKEKNLQSASNSSNPSPSGSPGAAAGSTNAAAANNNNNNNANSNNNASSNNANNEPTQASSNASPNNQQTADAVKA